MIVPQSKPKRVSAALPKSAPAMALSLALVCAAAQAQAGDAMPPGYAMEPSNGGVQLIFEDQTVFETAPPERLIGANVTGPHDMTGDGILNLVVYERVGRSSASLTVLSLSPDGPEVLMQTTGIAADMRGFEGITVDTDLSALLGLPTRPSPEDTLESAAEPETEGAPDVTGHWLSLAASPTEGFSAKLGWVEPEYSETEYATMLFRCPDDGDPYWVEPLIFHDTREEVPSQVTLDLDGTVVSLPVSPQMDDPRSDQWYAIGTLPRDTALFSQMAGAQVITMHYGELEPFVMAGGAAASDQREQILHFSILCRM